MTRPLASLCMLVIVGSIWAPVTWLLPVAILDFGDFASRLDSSLYVQYRLLIPAAIHLPLWIASRRASALATGVLAVLLGLSIVGLSMVVIALLSASQVDCGGDFWFGCPSRRDIVEFALIVGAGMVLLSLPAWIAASIFHIVHFVRRRGAASSS